MDAKEIIVALGGATALARDLGCGRTAVSNWARLGIPGHFWPRIARLAQQKNVPAITMDVLEGHRSRQAA
jgi:hypothetical protein